MQEHTWAVIDRSLPGTSRQSKSLVLHKHSSLCYAMNALASVTQTTAKQTAIALFPHNLLLQELSKMQTSTTTSNIGHYGAFRQYATAQLLLGSMQLPNYCIHALQVNTVDCC